MVTVIWCIPPQDNGDCDSATMMVYHRTHLVNRLSPIKVVPRNVVPILVVLRWKHHDISLTYIVRYREGFAIFAVLVVQLELRVWPCNHHWSWETCLSICISELLIVVFHRLLQTEPFTQQWLSCDTRSPSYRPCFEPTMNEIRHKNYEKWGY